MINFLPASLTPRLALLRAVIGGSVLLVIALLPSRSWQLYPTALLGLWLCVASLIHYASMAGKRSAAPRTRRWIPLRFSGSIGRFRLRPRGDGRRIEVRAGSEVLAEVIAGDDGDQLVFDPEKIPDSELEAFGTAIGQAIEMVAAAEEDRPTERQVAGPRSWTAAQRERGI